MDLSQKPVTFEPTPGSRGPHDEEAEPVRVHAVDGAAQEVHEHLLAQSKVEEVR